jgi:hypothetical protein
MLTVFSCHEHALKRVLQTIAHALNAKYGLSGCMDMQKLWYMSYTPKSWEIFVGAKGTYFRWVLPPPLTFRLSDALEDSFFFLFKQYK